MIVVCVVFCSGELLYPDVKFWWGLFWVLAPVGISIYEKGWYVCVMEMRLGRQVLCTVLILHLEEVLFAQHV